MPLSSSRMSALSLGPNDLADRTVGKPEPIPGRREDRATAYKEMMEAMDTGIDRIVREINSLGLEQETFIFFCSDNGPIGPGSNGPLRGKKGALGEGGHRVPFIVRWPSEITEGSVCDKTICLVDLLATSYTYMVSEVVSFAIVLHAYGYISYTFLGAIYFARSQFHKNAISEVLKK